jgi:hypothetical protein
MQNTRALWNSLIQLDTSRKASNQSEKSKDANEQKLEAIGIKSEWVFLLFNIATDGGNIGIGLGRSSQKGRNGSTLLAFQFGQTIIISKDLVLCKAGLGGLLVVKAWRRGSVDGRVQKDWLNDLSGSTSVDLSKTEALCGGSKRWVSLALWRRLGLQ